MATAVGAYPGSSTALNVYNLPFTTGEEELYSHFPTAQYVNLVRRQNETSGSQKRNYPFGPDEEEKDAFNTPYECQRVYAECQGGKEISGRMVHAEYSEAVNYSSPPPQQPAQNDPHQNREPYARPPQSAYDNSDRALSGQRDYPHGQQQNSSRPESGCTLTVSNLPYSATEREIRKEFPEAFRVVLTLDERGRSRGVAQLSFSNQEQCNAALRACNYKMLSGRPVRGRIVRDPENGQNDYTGGQQRDYGSRDGRFNNYNSGRQDRDGYRHQQGGGRGGRDRFGPRDFNRGGRSDSYGNRRDRSPVRGEPVRGYGSSKGPRITSAVIHRPGADRSDSSSDED